MNISKLLLIDAALLISAIPLLFLLQGGNKKSSLLKTLKKELLKKSSTKLPDKEKLVELEEKAKNFGSGIEFNSLFGDWSFVSVWNKDFDEEDAFFSSFLRIFSAKLNLKKEISNENSPRFSVNTSIQFGLLTIEFLGSGYLKGKQPLLTFFFNIIELKSGSKVLFSRSLKEPEEKKKSFFSLIALEQHDKCLSARGQGGALILWLKD